MDLKTKRKLFDECIKDAISLGRKYMGCADKTDKPTDAEWDLTLILFQYKLYNKNYPKTHINITRQRK